MDVGRISVPCGCETRKDTIGTENWWTIVTLSGAALIFALSYGGSVTKNTKHIIRIALAGAAIAVIADKIPGGK